MFNAEAIERYVIPNAGQSFNGNDYRMLRSPGVYVYLKDNIPLYIGYSNSLLRRLGAMHRQAEYAIRECDEIRLFPCISTKAAQELETILICRMKPVYNRRKKTTYVRNLLGVRELRENTPAISS